MRMLQNDDAFFWTTVDPVAMTYQGYRYTMPISLERHGLSGEWRWADQDEKGQYRHGPVLPTQAEALADAKRHAQEQSYTLCTKCDMGRYFQPQHGEVCECRDIPPQDDPDA